jgi:hypothetical protein
MIPTSRSPGSRLWSASVAVFLGGLLLASGESAAEGEAPTGPDLRGFEPALMIGFGVHAQDLRGKQSADFVEVTPGRQGKLRFSFSEAEAVLYSPTISERFGLRFFVRGGGQFPFTREQVAENSIASYDSVADEASYREFCPEAAPQAPGDNAPGFEIGTGGTGFCEVRGRNEAIVNGSLTAGLGFDITLPIASKQFHLRPSINWFGQSLKGEARTVRSTSLERTHNCSARDEFRTIGGMQVLCNDRTLNNNNRDRTDSYTVTYMQTDEVRSKSGERWMHGLGPRLELDIEVAKVGNMIFEFFAQVGIYWILTDRTIEHSSTGQIGNGKCSQKNPVFLDPDFDAPNLCSPTNKGGEPIRAFYRVDAGAHIVQGGGGFRVVWRGFSL